MSNEAMLQGVVAKFAASFTPVTEVNQSDMLTGPDVYHKFQEFWPGDYTQEALNMLLLERFTYKYDAQMGAFVWLIKAKPPGSV